MSYHNNTGGCWKLVICQCYAGNVNTSTRFRAGSASSDGVETVDSILVEEDSDHDWAMAPFPVLLWNKARRHIVKEAKKLATMDRVIVRSVRKKLLAELGYS